MIRSKRKTPRMTGALLLSMAAACAVLMAGCGDKAEGGSGGTAPVTAQTLGKRSTPPPPIQSNSGKPMMPPPPGFQGAPPSGAPAATGH